ncbi:hypothetical protein BsWGS_22552 [Bradybaena similaris]
MFRVLLPLSAVLTSTFLTTAQITPGSGTAATTVGQQPAFSVPPSAPPTAMLLTIATMISGQYSNAAQYRDEQARNATGPNRHSLIEATYVPVLMPVLGSGVAFYYEQRVNNETGSVRKGIHAFSQETACLVRMSTFDIANASRFSVTPEGLQALEKLQPQELANRPECDVYWEQTGDDFYTSYLSSDQCTFNAPGGIVIRPDGSRNLTCSGMSLSEVWRRVPGDQIVGGTASPYLLQKVGDLYPVPVSAFSSNQCFVIPCTNSSTAKNSGPTWSVIKEQMNYAKKTDSQNSNGI